VTPSSEKVVLSETKIAVPVELVCLKLTLPIAAIVTKSSGISI